MVTELLAQTNHVAMAVAKARTTQVTTNRRRPLGRRFLPSSTGWPGSPEPSLVTSGESCNSATTSLSTWGFHTHEGSSILVQPPSLKSFDNKHQWLGNLDQVSGNRWR
jgi:hypothetical protein